jgi:ATP-dependent helicase/DNAse subunit B
MITTLIKGQVALPIGHEIRSRLENGCADTFLHIVPTDHARLKWHHEYLKYTPNRAISGLHIYSLEYLVRLLYRRLNKGRTRIGVGIQTVWSHEIMEEEQLPFLRPSPGNPVPQGTAKQLREAINQLRTSGIDWQHLQEDSTSEDAGAADKLADLITFYQAYETRLGSLWADRADIHRAVSEILDQNPAHAERLMKRIFPDIDLVIVSGFDVLSLHDFAILTGIANLPSMKMGIVLDFDEQNESLFGHIKADHDRFLSCGFEGHNAGIETPTAARNLHFARNLFRAKLGERSPTDKLDLRDQISLLSPTNRIQEVEEIAKLIKRLALNQPSLALHQVCVTFYTLDAYAPLIREIFPFHGIPYSLEWGERLENSTVIVSIFSLLEQIQGIASSRTREQVERSPYFQTDDWDSVIDSCGLNMDLPPDVFRESFDRLMDTLKVLQQILKGSWESKTRFAVHKVNAFREFRRLIDELVEFLKMRFGTETCYPFNSYIRWLRLMTSQTTYQWENPNGDGVRILPLIQTKDLSFDTVILGGLVDGDFPAVFRSDTFLPSKHRGTESDRLREDRFLFYQALTLYRKQLYLLRPQHNGDVELTPSAFIGELQRVAEINTDVDDDDTLSSTEDFLKNYGTYVWGHSETEPVEKPAAPSTLSPRLDLIAHNVRVEKSRTVTHEFPQYEGQLVSDLLSPASHRALERRREWTYSATQLETYGECPFRYFSDNVLRLKQIEEEEPGLTSIERGSLAHKILFEFYDWRRNAPPISDCTDEQFEEAYKDLHRIARSHLDAEMDRRHLNRTDRLFWDIEAERLIGGHGRTGSLPAFLEAEKGRKFEVHPRYFEVGFGLSDRSGPTDPHLGSREAIKVGEVSLSGKIDRVELGDGMFIIGDYKTGRTAPKLNDILEGRSLQLLLYIAAVEQLLQQQSPSIPSVKESLESIKGVGGVYYILQEESKAELGIGDKEYNKRAFQAPSQNRQLVPNRWYDIGDTEDDSEFDALRCIVDETIKYANEYVRSIAEGDFQLTPHDKTKVCRYCSFKRICRVGVIAEDIPG